MSARRDVQIVVYLFFMASQAIGQSALDHAQLGDFRLENGQVIEACRVGYRTFGRLNSDRSNAVLFPTWFGGTSEHLASLVGPGKMVDSTGFFVIAVDALGDGVSSSPSNSMRQPGAAFPEFNIRDMVESQYRLVSEVLGIPHLRAVIGGSMGGMQTFQWVVSHPKFMDMAVTWVGTPKLTSYDLLLWQTELAAIEAGQLCHSPKDAIMRIVAGIQYLAVQTPAYRVRQTAASDYAEFLNSTMAHFADIFEADDWASQLKAMIAHDVSAPFGGSLEKAAAVVQAKMLIIVGTQDHMVNPKPSLEFARLVHAETLELSNDCGHLSVGCEMDRVAGVVTEFLAQGGR